MSRPRYERDYGDDHLGPGPSVASESLKVIVVVVGSIVLAIATMTACTAIFGGAS